MMEEWAIHNLAYSAFLAADVFKDVSAKIEQCKHVDLDNNNEGYGLIDFATNKYGG